MPAMAMLDRDGLYGAPRFHLAAKKAGVRAHIGAEITCTDGRTYPLLVETREGYRNLCRLITRMKLRAKKGEGAAEWEEIEEFARGLICLTRHPDARLVSAFGRENVFAELQRHMDRDEEAANQALVERARALHIGIVAANAPAYAGPRQREVLDVLTCVRHHTTLDEAGRLLARNAERHVKGPTEMARLFADLPEAIARTKEISDRLAFTLAELGYEFPRYPRAGRRNHGVVPAAAHGRGRAAALPPLSRTRPPPGGARVGVDRKAEAGRLLPDRLGPGALLPRARHPGAGPRLGRQQRGLLFARHHCGGPRRHGPAVRALPLRGARRVARHRYRPCPAATTASA